MGNKKDVVVENMKKDLGVEHMVREERGLHIRSSYSWGTEYAKERYEEQRSMVLPEGTSLDTAYAYQLLVNADVCHMVIFNAYNRGAMDKDLYLDIMSGTIETLKRVVPYLRKEKQNNSEVYEEMAAIYKRLKNELKENDLIN